MVKDDASLNNNLREIREFLGLDMTAWARWIGVSASHVKLTEDGDRSITEEYIGLIRKRLPIKVSRFYQGAPKSAEGD